MTNPRIAEEERRRREQRDKALREARRIAERTLQQQEADERARIDALATVFYDGGQ